MGGFVEGDPSTELSSVITYLHDGRDIVVTKRRVSAFAGSDLDVVLRGLGIENLVLGGISTSGAVLSTVRQAADLDYSLTVLIDLCLDPDEELHGVLMEKVLSRQAHIKSTEEWIQGLGPAT